ncbi:hypothetical protein F5Y18DRAFT_325936 [Xylariaceae sp. FL1019]|nr:hypothetical protein F5Y18DRAFT_325936 [Xylariaceae sp. FL1019]
MPAETHISTPLPAGINEQSLINALHSHDAYVRVTCPQLISQTHISGSPNLNEPCAYEVTDKRAMGQTTFKLTLTNVSGGVDATVEGKTPTGSMVIRSQWRVAGGNLDENVEIESNVVTKKLVKGNVEKGHPGFHQGFLTQAAQA